MSISIRGGVANADIIETVYLRSSYNLVLEHEGEKYYAALSPTDDEAKSYMLKVPKEFHAFIEIKAKKRFNPLIFKGNGKIKDFVGRGKHLLLILSTNRGSYSLVFAEISTGKLKQKSIGKSELENQPCEVAFEF